MHRSFCLRHDMCDVKYPRIACKLVNLVSERHLDFDIKGKKCVRAGIPVFVQESSI